MSKNKSEPMEFPAEIEISIGGNRGFARLRRFSSGKWGYGSYGKLAVKGKTADGKEAEAVVQLSMNAAIPHSENIESS